jgi:hypothetical protein
MRNGTSKKNDKICGKCSMKKPKIFNSNIAICVFSPTAVVWAAVSGAVKTGGLAGGWVICSIPASATAWGVGFAG